MQSYFPLDKILGFSPFSFLFVAEYFINYILQSIRQYVNSMIAKYLHGYIGSEDNKPLVLRSDQHAWLSFHSRCYHSRYHLLNLSAINQLGC